MVTKVVENMDDSVWEKFAGLSKIKGKKVGVYLTEILQDILKKEGVK